jgi:hypothetical protein
MKELYTSPEMEIINFNSQDIIATSEPDELPVVPDEDNG